MKTKRNINRKINRRTVSAGIASLSAALLSSCGTLLYPERREARKDETMSDKIDVLIVALDAVGLLFFIVPGLVAFAVDFGTGAIYLPKGKKHGDKEMTVFDEMSMNTRISTPIHSSDIETVVNQATGFDLDFREQEMLALRINHIDEAGIANTRLFARQRMVSC
jgi:hypothetical protein